MKITRQLRLDRLASDGTAQIQLTIAWEGNRLRLGTGAIIKPCAYGSTNERSMS